MMKLRPTPSKADIYDTKNHEHIAMLMEKYLDEWGIEKKMGVEFIEAYMKRVKEKALSGEVRLPLPMMLGYLQVLEHAYEGEEIEHLRKFGNVDYSFIWVKHPLFAFHRMEVDEKVNEEAREKKLQGIKYLKEYVDGNTYTNA